MGLFRKSTIRWPPFCVAAAGRSRGASLGNPAGLLLAVIDRIWVASMLNIGWAVVALTAAWSLRGHGAVSWSAAFAIAYTLHRRGNARLAHDRAAPPIPDSYTMHANSIIRCVRWSSAISTGRRR